MHILYLRAKATMPTRRTVGLFLLLKRKHHSNKIKALTDRLLGGGSTAVLAATEPAVEVVTPEYRLSVLTNQVVGFVAGGRIAWGSQLRRNCVRNALVTDFVKLDQILNKAAGIFLGA
jgi:hypothetical protein